MTTLLNSMATPWTEAWPEIATRAAAPPRLLVACDFDGTLAPLAADPAAVALPVETLEVLRRLQAAPGVSLAFISGRALADLRARVPLPDAIFAGNHGLEIRGLGLDGERSQAAMLKPRLAVLAERIRTVAVGFTGLCIENKGLTLSVHLRHVSVEQRAAATRAVVQAGSEDAAFRLQRGHLVLEFLPDIGWDKGAAMKQIAARLGLPRSAAFYAGDDTTDESVFQALPTAMTVHVGNDAATAARWTARDPAEVLELLDGIARTRRGGAR